MLRTERVRGSAAARLTATSTDATAGVDTDRVSTMLAAGDLATVGERSARIIASDRAGNFGEVTCAYRVVPAAGDDGGPAVQPTTAGHTSFDSDGDGVPQDRKSCPATANGTRVQKGQVTVRERAARRRITVRAGESDLARARMFAARRDRSRPDR